MRFGKIGWGNLLALALSVLAAALTLHGVHDPHGLLFAAPATYGVTTAKTDLNKLWRKVNTPVMTAAQFEVPEWDMLDDVPEENIDWSAREINMPLDTQDETGIASIAEGDYESRPSSVSVSEAQLTWILMTGSFTVSKTVKWIDANSRKAQIERQLIQQGKKKLQALMRRVGEYYYGFSTGVMAKVSATAGDDITLKDLYGVAGVGSTTAPFQVANVFKKNEWIAVLNPAGPAIRGFCQIASVTPATPKVTAVAGTVPAGTAANDLIVFANSLRNDANALASCDYNAALTGFLDITTSTSLHGLSSAADSKWQAGFTSTTAQRLTGTLLRKMRTGIQNQGGGDLTNVQFSQGIETDAVALYQAGVRYTDAFGLELDGKVKFADTKFMSTRFVPSTYAFGFDRKSIRKMQLIPKPGQPVWDDGYKLQDLSGFKFTIDWPVALLCTNRGNTAYASNLTES